MNDKDKWLMMGGLAALTGGLEGRGTEPVTCPPSQPRKSKEERRMEYIRESRRGQCGTCRYSGELKDGKRPERCAIGLVHSKKGSCFTWKFKEEVRLNGDD